MLFQVQVEMDIYDVRFKSASVITVAVSSQSGKPTIVQNIVEQRTDLFTDPISSVAWYFAYLPTTKLNGVVYKTSLPQFDSIYPHSLVIINDYMQELSNAGTK